MLMCNGVVVNTTAPKTELDKEVSLALKEIAKKFRLGEGRTVTFNYPESLKSPDKDNPGRFDSPRGLKIDYVGVQTLKDGSGTRTWRYFNSSIKNKNGNTTYNPSFYIFDGNWTLGARDIELIFFLLNVFPRLEGGDNRDVSKAAIMEIKDDIAFAKKEVEKRRARVAIEARLYLPADKGGLSEKEIKALAARLMIPFNEGDDTIDTLILAVSNKLKTNPSLVHMASASNELPDVDSELAAVVQLSLDAKNVFLAKNNGQKLMWAWRNAAGQPVQLCPIAANKNEKEALITFLKKNPDKVERLNEMLQASMSAKVESEAEAPDSETEE